MTMPSDPDQFAELLAGIDSPRPLPDDLLGNLEDLLHGSDPVARLAATSTTAVPVPPDLRARLEATMSGTVLPRPLRRRLVRSLTQHAPTSIVMRAAIVVVVMLLIAGGVATAAMRSANQTTPVAAAPRTTTSPSPETTTVPTTEPAPTTTAAPVAKPRVVKPKKTKHSLIAYSSCDALLSQTKARALELVGPYGFAYYRHAIMYSTAQPARSATASAATADPSSQPQPQSSPQPDIQSVTVAPADASLTNVQEAGVDEPDQIKTDGTRFFNLVNGLKVRAVRLARGTASVAGTVDLPAGDYQDLLLAGDRLIAFGTGRSDGTAANYYDYRRGFEAVIVTIDISDLAAMRVTSVLSFQGRIVSSRLLNGIARVVVESNSVGPKFVSPTDGSPEAQQQATDENKAIVANSSLDDWVPHYTLNDLSSGEQKQTTGRLCNCDKALHPTVVPGFDTVSVLTIDPKKPTPGNGVTIQGSGGTVYASSAALYVSSYEFPTFAVVDRQPQPQPAQPQPAQPVEPQPQPAQSDQAQPPSGSAQPMPPQPVTPVGTSIHKFDITGSDAARYAGSGLIPGAIKDQFSMSEFEGVLRAVTTTFEDTSVTALTTMAERDGVLVPLGTVGDIGRGETVQAVRMLGKLGYVVTFKRTDPLFVLDLANPSLPRIAGELNGARLLGLSASDRRRASSRHRSLRRRERSHERRAGIDLRRHRPDQSEADGVRRPRPRLVACRQRPPRVRADGEHRADGVSHLLQRLPGCRGAHDDGRRREGAGPAEAHRTAGNRPGPGLQRRFRHAGVRRGRCRLHAVARGLVGERRRLTRRCAVAPARQLTTRRVRRVR